MKKVTPKNLAIVTIRLVAQADQDKRSAIKICAALNELLDDLRAEDFFGTEGQLDPRGDGRND